MFFLSERLSGTAGEPASVGQRAPVRGSLAYGYDRWVRKVPHSVYGTFRGSGGASRAAVAWFSVEAVQASARVNVTCVTPLGEEVASIS